jgi:hypothetical protein
MNSYWDSIKGVNGVLSIEISITIYSKKSMKKINIVKFSDKKIGFLYKSKLYDINSFNKLDTESYSNLKSSKLHNLPLQPINIDFISELKSTFPYTKIGKTYVFHLNWTQKFFVRINEDNTMNIYSGYPIWILKRLLSFIKYNEHNNQI